MASKLIIAIALLIFCQLAPCQLFKPQTYNPIKYPSSLNRPTIPYKINHQIGSDFLSSPFQSLGAQFKNINEKPGVNTFPLSRPSSDKYSSNDFSTQIPLSNSWLQHKGSKYGQATKTDSISDQVRASLVFSPAKKPQFDFLNYNSSNIGMDKQQCNYPRIKVKDKCICPNGEVFRNGVCGFGGESNFTHSSKSNKDLIELRKIKRNFDGTMNNIGQPQWGSKNQDLLRLTKPNYRDGQFVVRDDLPNPRVVSNTVGQIEGNRTILSQKGWSMLLPMWGQFLDHDITLTPENSFEKLPISIPRCDRFFDPNCTGRQQLPFKRSVFNSDKRIRTNINVITAWIDASSVYGSDKQTADSLREFKLGKLKNTVGNMLPKDSKGNFLAGDQRANENIALTAFHTIFMREHNRICDIIDSTNEYLTDEETFQIARNYVIGLIQHITFDEFLPALLGEHNFKRLIGDYSYEPGTNPGIFTEFSTAGYRLGHPLINSPFKLMDNSGNILEELELGEMFFNPSKLKPETVNEIFNGLSRTLMKERSIQVVKELRNFLFLTPGHTVKVDLFSFNIQRGRDHGLGSINTVRKALGLKQVWRFTEYFENYLKSFTLRELYKSLDETDLWLGIIGEKKINGAILGETGIALNARQFKNIRNSDRFWYEAAFPKSIVRQIKNTSLSDVIKRNTDVKHLGKNSFLKL